MSNDILKMLKTTHDAAFETLSVVGDAKVANEIALSLFSQLVSNLDLDQINASEQSLSNFTHRHSQMGDIAIAIMDYLGKANDLLENIA